jgi:uncharacterized protein (DUF433 family)
MMTTVQTVPLKIDKNGVMHVGGTRVTLETVVESFREGATAEEIVQQYPTLDLADVYAVIAYYLREKKEVEAYLKKQQNLSETVRQENEKRFNPHGIRERLLARR